MWVSHCVIRQDMFELSVPVFQHPFRLQAEDAVEKNFSFDIGTESGRPCVSITSGQGSLTIDGDQVSVRMLAPAPGKSRTPLDFITPGKVERTIAVLLSDACEADDAMQSFEAANNLKLAGLVALYGEGYELKGPVNWVIRSDVQKDS